MARQSFLAAKSTAGETISNFDGADDDEHDENLSRAPAKKMTRYKLQLFQLVQVLTF